MKKELEKEYKKLEDLEFEYKIAQMYKKDDDAIVRMARAKYASQVRKIKKMEKER